VTRHNSSYPLEIRHLDPVPLRLDSADISSPLGTGDARFLPAPLVQLPISYSYRFRDLRYRRRAGSRSAACDEDLFRILNESLSGSA
jgi:hypothetical protein